MEKQSFSFFRIFASFIDVSGMHACITRTLRYLSFLDSPTPSKDRLVQTIKIAEKLKENEVFPLKFGDFEFKMETQPVIIKL